MSRITNRSNGEGTYHQRKDGSWQVQLRVGRDALGKPIRLSASGKTKAEAKRALDRLRIQARQGAVVRTKGPTLEQYLTTWVSDALPLKVKPTTAVGYGVAVRHRLIPLMGHLRLDKITHETVREMLSQLQKNGVAERTRQLTFHTLSSALQDAFERDMIATNPCRRVTLKTPPLPPVTPLTPEQAKQLLDAAEDSPLYALYVLALTTGMRQGEMLALHWTDLDLDRGFVTVSKTLSEINSEPFLSDPKTRSSYRKIDLHTRTIQALRGHRARLLEAGLPLKWVFPDQIGGPMRKSNLMRRSFKPLLKAAGLPDIRFHDLRHTYATTMLIAGVSPKVVQHILGHATIAITMDRYSHFMPCMHQQALDGLDRVLRRIET